MRRRYVDTWTWQGSCSSTSCPGDLAEVFVRAAANTTLEGDVVLRRLGVCTAAWAKRPNDAAIPPPDSGPDACIASFIAGDALACARLACVSALHAALGARLAARDAAADAPVAAAAAAAPLSVGGGPATAPGSSRPEGGGEGVGGAGAPGSSHTDSGAGERAGDDAGAGAAEGDPASRLALQHLEAFQATVSASGPGPSGLAREVREAIAREARAGAGAIVDLGAGGGAQSAEVVRAAVAALPPRLLKQLPALLGQAGLSATAAARVAACLRALVAIAPRHQPLLLAELEAQLFWSAFRKSALVCI